MTVRSLPFDLDAALVALRRCPPQTPEQTAAFRSLFEVTARRAGSPRPGVVAPTVERPIAPPPRAPSGGKDPPPDVPPPDPVRVKPAAPKRQPNERRGSSTGIYATAASSAPGQAGTARLDVPQTGAPTIELGAPRGPIPDPQRIVPTRRSKQLLGMLCRRPAGTSSVDIAELCRVVASGRVVDLLPTARVMTMASTVEFWLDIGSEMTPFLDELDAIADDLLALTASVDLLRFDGALVSGSPSPGARVIPREVLPRPNSVVVIATNVGVHRRAYSRYRRTWIRGFGELRAAGVWARHVAIASHGRLPDPDSRRLGTLVWADHTSVRDAQRSASVR